MAKKIKIIENPKTDPKILRVLIDLHEQYEMRAQDLSEAMGFIHHTQYTKKVKGQQDFSLQDFVNLINYYRPIANADDLNQAISLIFNHKTACFVNATGNTAKLIREYEKKIDGLEKDNYNCRKQLAKERTKRIRIVKK